MINVDELKKAIDDSGYKLTFIAKKLGLSYQGFLNKMQGKYEFTASEIKILCDLLHLTEEKRKKIFFM